MRRPRDHPQAGGARWVRDVAASGRCRLGCLEPPQHFRALGRVLGFADQALAAQGIKLLESRRRVAGRIETAPTNVQWDNTSDVPAGLLYMHARHYSPELGRFLQPDPSAVEANLYVYAVNSPLSRLDPAGEAGPVGRIGLAPWQIGNYGEAHAARLLTELGWRIVARHYRTLGGARIVDIVAVQGNKRAYVEVKANRGNYNSSQRANDPLVVRQAAGRYGKANVDAFLMRITVDRITGAATFKSIRSVGANRFAVGFGRLLGLGGNRKVKP